MSGFLNKLINGKYINTKSKSEKNDCDNAVDVVKNKVNEPAHLIVPNLSDEEKNHLIEQLAQNDSLEYRLFELDELFDDAARLVVSNQEGSISLIQRRFTLGYNRAGRIMDQLENAKIVVSDKSRQYRQALFTDKKSLEQHLKSIHYLNDNWIFLFYEENKLAIELKRAEFEDLKQLEIDNLEREQIKQQILEKERKKRLEREALSELIEEGKIFNEFTNKEGKRELIPQDIMDKVWNRDGGKCVKCGSQENLEFDHIIPFSKGGATSYRNIQLLCKKCNVEKSNNIG